MFERFAVYITFDGLLGKRGADWLGWDISAGLAALRPRFDGIDLEQVTARPHPYGFHATIKAPFRLATGHSEEQLRAAFVAMCADLKPARSEGLHLSRIGRFLALTLNGDDSGIKVLAANVVQTLDPFRAPLTKQEIARRNPARLSDIQRANLMEWGYPHVMENFQFHATLTGPLKAATAAPVLAAAEQHFSPVLPAPIHIAHLTLAGQKSDGMFHEILRSALRG